MKFITTKYLYDLFIRFTPYSLITSLIILSFFKEINEKQFEDNLPIDNNYCLEDNIVNTRSIIPLVGNLLNLRIQISYFFNTNYLIVNKMHENFISDFSIFLDEININLLNLYTLNESIFYLNYKFLNNNIFLTFFDNVKINDFSILSLENIIDLDFKIDDNDSDIIYQNTRLISLYTKKKNFLSIKFKRLLFKYIYNYKLRQKKFSKFLKKKIIFNKLNAPLSMQTDLFLWDILNKSFYFHKTDIIFLLKNNYIYLNGLLCSNLKVKLNLYDRVQVRIDNYIFLQKRTIFNKIIKDEINLNYYYHKFDKFRNSNIISTGKFNKKYFKSLFYLLEDIPTYIEVDYSSLTLFILNKPKKLYEKNFFLVYFLNLYTTKFLNWTYSY